MEEKKANPLSTSLAKLSGSLRGISTAKDFHFYNNFDEFKRPVAQLAADSQSMLESIGISSPELFGKQLAFPQDLDDAYDWLVNVNDEIYESFDHAVDEFRELRSGVENGVDLVNGKKRSGAVENEDSSLSEVKVAQKDDRILGAKPKIPFHIPTIPKPQKQYKIIVNNSKQPFEHVWLQRTEDGSKFIHPLEKFSPTDFVDKNVTDIKPMKPLPVDFTTYTLVEEVDDLKELAAKLRCADEFAVDLEHNQYRSYQGLTCLMQISTRAEDFVVDTLKLRAHIGSHLRELFIDPTKKKVMHGADRDIMWLQRDFGIYVCNMFDTGQASRVLKLERNSLEHLLQHFCEVAANKEYQNADWRLRPLTDEMLRYAREDTHYLLYIYDLMRIRLHSLSAESGSSDASLVEVYQRSYDICMQLYEKDVLTDSSYLHIYGIQSADLNAQQLAVAAGLCEWRDVVARAEDESTGYILPNKILLEIAKQMPYTTSKLRGVMKFRHHYIDRNLSSVVNIIRNSMQNAAAYEDIAKKLKEERIKAGADGNSVVSDGSEAVSSAVLDGSNSATGTDGAMRLENILELEPSSNEVDRNKHKNSSDHLKDNLNIHDEKDGHLPSLTRNDFTMPSRIREASEIEATVQVLKKPNRAFGALLGKSAAKRKFDHGRKETEEAKLEQIKSSVNLPFHQFSGKMETFQPVVEEPAKPPVSLHNEEPVAVLATNSRVQDVIMIDDESDDELLVDDPKSADDELEQIQGKTLTALLPTNSKSDDELFNDDPNSTDDMLEQTEGNEKAPLPSINSPSHDVVLLDDDTDEEPVNDDPKCADDMLQKDKVHTPASSNEKETPSDSDNRPETTNEMGNTKPVKKLKEQEFSNIQIKPFDYEAAIKEFHFGGDRGSKVGAEERKNSSDGGNRKKSAAKSQSEGGEESGGFQLGRRRQAFPATGNRSATFR